jgi:carboxymethylenebutenolidase
MCDELTEKDNLDFLKGKLDRRSFTGLGTIAAFTAILPSSACGTGATDETTKDSGAMAAASVIETEVNVPMSDGVSDSYFVHPAKGAHAAVLMWPDIKGLRPAFKAMGKRMAEAGYAVLVVNPFYRDAKHPVVGPGASFGDPETRTFLRGMAGKLTQDAAMSDARDYIAFLDSQEAVDTTRKVGTAGYCMGGPLVIRTSAAVPERVAAVASFHGGGMVRDTDNSPHLLLPQTTAAALHAVAENDDERNPEMKVKLAEAYAAAGLSAEIEVYPGTKHGWCPPDSQVYDEAMAEKAWSRMMALFEMQLA